MEQKLKSILRVIALCLILLLSSCEKDLYENAISENHQIILKKISLRDSYLKSNLELFKCVDKLQNKKIDSQAKLISDNENGFYFDDQNGIYIENGKTKSYTFPIYRANSDDKIENLVFSLNKSGNYDAYTVKYDFSEEEFRYLTKQELKQKQVKYTPISYTPTSTTGRIGVMCTENWTGVTTSLYGNCTQTHSNNETCTPMTTTTWVLTSTDCYSTDGGDPGDLNNISTTPVINNADTSLEVLGITREQYNWLTKQNPSLKSCVYAFAAEPEEGIYRYDAVYFLMTNLQLTNSLTNFLVLNNNVDGQAFAVEMITSMINNDGYSGDSSMGDYDVDNVNYTGPKQLIPKQITLNDGSTVDVIFGTTSSDNRNANNQVAVKLVNSIVFALNKANSNLDSSEKITSIYIAATTNGAHSSTSNHSKGTAVDISRINHTKIISLGWTC
jgi:hypothetical protein